MANSVINEDTGPALNIATSSTMLAHSLSGTKPQQMSLADWRKVLETALTALTKF
jgi:hypothetical protein